MITFALLITTKNRIEDLKYTLNSLKPILSRKDVECVICDDGSNDGTYKYIEQNFTSIKLLGNTKSRGLIYSRNRLMSATTASYAISLDDDAHFLSENVLETIKIFFDSNQKCAVISFRLFWSKIAPSHTVCKDSPYQTRSFLGGANAIRMSAWRDIPNYPSWFLFHGEEEFASYHMLKKELEVWYVPAIFAQHRVDMKKRKKNKDYRLRLRRSLRSGWYLYFLFYPYKLIPKKLLYSVWMQFKLKVFRGDYKAFFAILQAMGDMLINMPRLMAQRNALNTKELEKYYSLPPTKIYWKPNE